ncbi:PREDICTED: fatty acid-binding protein, muscle isoform X3 [Wasmannia auropunctata]|uniref:fatty acid-binding protein, muscle isoform X3 n=1 Tax=Wasmannia auropunctata TaxID=64793 RepID=UPI0005EF078F|nr:PREDICTED: fatty acid-binding protein, muscle isoform X3 [Wasmannia auropunctata]
MPFAVEGVGMVTRKMGSSVSPVVELTEKDGTYTLKTTSPFKNSEIKFQLGAEFDEETVDGRKVKSVCTLDGNKLVQVQKGEKDTTIEREFGPTEMKAIMKVDDIVCTRVYKVQE